MGRVVRVGEEVSELPLSANSLGEEGERWWRRSACEGGEIKEEAERERASKREMGTTSLGGNKQAGPVGGDLPAAAAAAFPLAK